MINIFSFFNDSHSKYEEIIKNINTLTISNIKVINTNIKGSANIYIYLSMSLKII